MSPPVASVVIPAHNEENVLGRCLDTLLAQAAPGEFEVVVAANGCTDATVEIASRYRDRGVRVVETDVPSKIAALNLGDRAATVLPRVYLDADVTIDTAALRALARVLDDDAGPLAAAPRMRVDTSRSSVLARAYLEVWQSLPVFGSSYVGSGCYGLSRAGRARFDEFPDVVGDDRFVYALYPREAKLTLDGHALHVSGPRTLPAIMKRSVRVRSGTTSLDAAMATIGYVVADAGSSAGTRAYLLDLLHRRQTCFPALLFAVMQVAIQLAARAWAFAGRDRTWIRDETSRT